ncbi:hypothetical protein ACQ86L_0770 (plasmid) [Leifsonia sp. P73]
MHLPGRRAPILAIIAMVVATLVTACSSTSSGDANRMVRPGLTESALCGIAKSPLAQDALPKTVVHQGEQFNNASGSSCTQTGAAGSNGLAKVAAIYGDFNMKNTEAIYKSLTDGSSNSKQQCPQGSRRPRVSEGLVHEAAMICVRDDRSIFEYTGESVSGTFVVRVERPRGTGKVADGDAQRWVDVVAAKVLIEAGGKEGAKGNSASTASASPSTASGGDGSLTMCPWLLSVLQSSSLVDGLSGATFTGAIGVHDSGDDKVMSCLVTPVIASLGTPDGQEGVVWVEVRKERPLAGPVNFHYKNFEGYKSGGNEFFVNTDGVSIFLSVVVDIGNAEIPLSAQEPFATGVIKAVLDKWSSGDRPVHTPASSVAPTNQGD